MKLTANGDVRTGGNGVNGGLTLQATDGSDRIRLQGGNANAWLGGNGADGDIAVFANGDNATLGESTIHLGGAPGTSRRRERGQRRADPPGHARGRSNCLQGASANALLGGNGVDGDLFMFPRRATTRPPDRPRSTSAAVPVTCGRAATASR